MIDLSTNKGAEEACESITSDRLSGPEVQVKWLIISDQDDEEVEPCQSVTS